MFHVHADRRTQHSAQTIALTLLKLMNHQDFQQITIADLQKETGIARSTFYRSFDNLMDVLEWQCDQQFATLFAQIGSGLKFPNEKEILQQYLAYWGDHPEILVQLIKIQRVDIIYKYQNQYAQRTMMKYGPLDNQPTLDRKYFLSIRMGILLGILLPWLQSGQPESIDQLQQIAEQQLSYLMQSFK